MQYYDRWQYNRSTAQKQIMTKNNPKNEIYSIMYKLNQRDTKTYWLRIGAGYKNRNDSFGLVFQAMPLPDPQSGLLRLYMRPFRPGTEQDAAQGEDAFYLEIDPLMGAPLEEL